MVRQYQPGHMGMWDVSQKSTPLTGMSLQGKTMSEGGQSGAHKSHGWSKALGMGRGPMWRLTRCKPRDWRRNECVAMHSTDISNKIAVVTNCSLWFAV